MREVRWLAAFNTTETPRQDTLTHLVLNNTYPSITASASPTKPCNAMQM